MFIRRITIESRNRNNAGPYYSHRLVEPDRVGGQIEQHTLLHLFRHFDVPKGEWRALSSRIEQLLDGQPWLLSRELSAELETLAQVYAAQILAGRGEDTAQSGPCESLDLTTLELVCPRRVGIERVALHGLEQLALRGKLAAQGWKRICLAGNMSSLPSKKPSRSTI